MFRLKCHLFLILILYVPGYTQNARLGQVTEYQIKAAFLFNFAKFVEWPAEADSTLPITIGLIGQDPFGENLDQLAARKVIKGRKLRIKRFRRVSDLEACHILFISQSEKSNMPDILGRIKDLSILTVGEASWFAEQGGIVNLVSRNNKVRFQINVEASYRSGLKISSRLLRLAEIISDRYASRGREP